MDAGHMAVGHSVTQGIFEIPVMPEIENDELQDSDQHQDDERNQDDIIGG